MFLKKSSKYQIEKLLIKLLIQILKKIINKNIYIIIYNIIYYNLIVISKLHYINIKFIESHEIFYSNIII